ncbi:hypothetical protein [Sphingobium fontiphilum]|nr:hypothetical protein [Sphingobium fontiphilum]
MKTSAPAPAANAAARLVNVTPCIRPESAFRALIVTYAANHF